ncbi:MAG TPA: LuxR C-terminal-related transcriptional regulator [Anaerolineales bacterium]|nr:LuxR C-terminal-related transcriptional regulator [Anaerolineales bacterium]
MPEPLLRTKLFVPPSRPHRVLRPRLLERLNEGLASTPGVTVISAPAGFGKTTLLSEWIAGCHWPVAWLSLDEEDSDLSRFLTYFVTAVQQVAAPVGQQWLAHLQISQPAITERLLTPLLNEIMTVADKFILVLDDYHRIESRQVDDALAFLVEHQPPQMQLVIASREDPPLPLPRLRARGQLNELRATDLRFTPSEATEFLNQSLGLNLSPENIAALEIRTEGWITGLQLAALALQGQTDVTGFIKAFTGSHRFVLDYLVEEVLRGQPERVRDFLLRTAILDHFCASLCDAVTERGDGKAMLASLERGNLFLVQLDNERHWYRYHHLFAEVLQTHLVEALPGHVARLHQRASAWHEQSGLRPDAIRHSLAAEDFERAADLIELARPAAEKDSIAEATWYRWVKMLPEAALRVRPVLCVGFALALLSRGEIETAEAQLNVADRWSEIAGPETERCPHQGPEPIVADRAQWESLPAAAAIGRAYIAQSRGDTKETVRFARRALELTPQDDSYRHRQGTLMLAMTYWANGDLVAADRVFAEDTAKLRAGGMYLAAVDTTVVLGEIRLGLGRLNDAIQAVEQLLHYMSDRGETISPDAAELHRELGELYLERDQRAVATQQLQKSKEFGEKAELPIWRYRWNIAQARLTAILGDPEAALDLLDEAARVYVRTPLPDLRPISAMRARIWLQHGGLAQALAWVQQQGLTVADDPSFLREYDDLTLARILVAQYQQERLETAIHAATRLLDRLLRSAEDGGRMGSVIEILAIQALAHQAQGDIPSALALLKRALNLAEPQGFVRVFLDEGEPMGELLTRLQAEEGAQRIKGYASRLLAALGSASGTPFDERPRLIPTAQPGINTKSLIEPLSAHELEVLRLLGTELSGPEIARERVVSLNTIRTQTQHIYAKLGVNNRRAAVRRAEELGLL